MEEQKQHTTIARTIVTALFVVVFCTLPQQSISQTIRLVRSDVDTGRASFITATQMFGVDVVIDGVSNCTGVSFELRYTNAQHVVFSNIKARDFNVKNAFVVDLSDSTTGQGSIHASVLSGASVSEKGINNPVAFHVDFVVRSSAPNNQTVTFSFVDAQAVTTDSGGMIKQLTSTAYVTTIHGFVNVFPGDANNDGKVNSADGTTVGAYLGQGSGASNVRGYKREPSSTLWLPQRALVWDSASATYADCDGSGDVTISDQLVVQINFGQVHSSIKPDDDISGKVQVQQPVYPTDAQRVPVYISTNKTLLGAALVIKVPANTQVLGFEPSEQYPDAEVTLFKYDEVSSTVYVCFGSTFQQNILQSGFVGALVCNETTPINSYITEAYGATKGGSIFPLESVTAVEYPTEQTTSIVPQPASSVITITAQPNSVVQLYSSLGTEVASFVLNGTTQTLNIESIPNGTYYVRITQNNKSVVQRLVILH
ncbi:MAG: T9SS type A sorting domain-containing protein [Candidatus Kapabacteria bacterium]|nr:T9SS type A sorting domain-containing protein [Candidatus Kapabacteria bacterium]MBX7153343.1 T9SS type A sorting domain-containing protein [Bacteroidota bacterium]